MDSLTLRFIAVVVTAALSLSACSEQPPLMARGLSRDTPAFNERLRNRFPVASDEDTLTAELQKERFSVRGINDPSTPYRHLAQYDAHELVCKDVWTILWSAEAGKITMIEGKTGSICL